MAAAAKNDEEMDRVATMALLTRTRAEMRVNEVNANLCARLACYLDFGNLFHTASAARAMENMMSRLMMHVCRKSMTEAMVIGAITRFDRIKVGPLVWVLLKLSDQDGSGVLGKTLQ